MPSSNDCWGIEVGANAIKAVRLQKSGSNVALAEFDVLPFKKVLTTPDLDVDEAIRVGLDQFMSRHVIGKATVVVSVPGHMAFARFAGLPPVEPKRVPDIVKFEAQQQIPFPIDQVEWDYQTFQSKDSPDIGVGIFAITKERVLNWLGNFNALGIPVHGLTLSPLAVYNAMAFDMQLKDDAPGTILMDIGTSATDLIIVENGRIWLRTIPIGGTHFTEALVRSFKLSHSKAEKIKREAGTSKYARQIFQAMRPVFVDLVNEVQKSLGYYQSINREANLTQLIGLGSTFQLPGLQKFLKQQLQIEVSKLDKFERLSDPANAAALEENSLTLATAYGLAIQGLELERVSSNLLPGHMIRQQLWKSKQPFMVAAAALIAASAVISYVRLELDQRAFAANAPVRAQIEQVLSSGDSLTGQWTALSGSADPRPKIENLRRVLDYRRLMPTLVGDIQNALASTDPQPELLTNSVDQVKSIPRGQRRQVRVDNVAMEYKYGGTNDAESLWGTPGAMGVPGMMMDESMMMEEEMMSYEEDMMGMEGYGAMPIMPAAPTVDPNTPYFNVMITGTTPFEGAPNFIESTILDSLKKREMELREQDRMAKQDPAKYGPPRVYRIADVEMVSLTAVVNTIAPGMPGYGAPGMMPGLPGMLPGMGGPGGYGEYGEDPSMYEPEPMYDDPSMMEGQYGQPGLPGLPGMRPGMFPGMIAPPINLNLTPINALMPVDPLAEEKAMSTTDWQFVIRYRIELIKPETIRDGAVATDAAATDPSLEPAPIDAPVEPVAPIDPYSSQVPMTPGAPGGPGTPGAPASPSPLIPSVPGVPTPTPTPAPGAAPAAPQPAPPAPSQPTTPPVATVESNQ